jgi:hypothetical protein
MDGYWGTGYKSIKNCNFVIGDVDKYKPENAALADNIKGQALAIRTYIYFKLVNTFAQPYSFTAGGSHAGVPYITKEDISQSFTRNSVAEVYDNMIADLNTAINLLPATTTDTRFFSRLSAKALLARIYLFKEDYANAKSLATEIATQVPLMTIANGYPNDMYKFKVPSQTESLMQCTPSASPATNFLGRYFRTSSLRFYATSDIAVILTENANDVRRNWVKDTIVGGNAVRAVKKFPVSVAPEVNPVITIPEIAYYPPLLRSSEMFLTVAEAAAKTNDETTARTYLNAIRKRANPSIADVTATGPALIDSIYKERRKEMAFESLRLYDLQRWKLGVHRTDAVFPAAKDLNYPNNKLIAPVPISEISLGGLIQNPGY